ncbi:MAG: LamB/YcsF family protein, partial [Microbacteriaceae bacterium]
ADRVLTMVTEGRVTAVDGTRVPVNAESVCVHGDTPGAVAIAAAVRKRLTVAGVPVAPPVDV